MRTWSVKADDGQQWLVDAPDDATSAEVNAFAAEHADSWTNGGHYAMTEVPAEPAAPKAEPAALAKPATRNEQADAAAKSLEEQMQQIKSTMEALTTRQYAGPTDTGAVTGMAPTPDAGAVLARRAELQKQYDALKAQRDKLVIGSTGQTVGGIGGALGGAGIGVGIGALTGPLAPVAMPIGGVIGSILGGAAGVAVGTHLWDIPEAQEARDITDAEAAELIKSRAIQSLIWDGAFVLILGPGGRLIGKIADGARFLPALKAVAKESVAWDQIAKAKSKQLADVVEKRAETAPTGLATQASDALKIRPAVPDREASRQLVEDIAAQSGGRVPTTGEMSGIVGGGERFVRGQAPKPFFHNDRMLAEAAESIRKDALGVLDQAGAYEGTELGQAVKGVVQSANSTLRRETGPIFEEAARQNVVIDMRDTLRYIDGVLFRDTESAGSLLKGDRPALETLAKSLREEPFMSAQGVQDFISGQKAALRGLDTGGVKPGDFTSKAIGEIVKQADTSFINSLRTVQNPTLVQNLLQARQLYKDTMTDLYSDSMATLARKNPEDVGRALTGKGTITEIRDLRAALDRAVANAPDVTKYKPGTQDIAEWSKGEMTRERAKIDAGIVKGFIEKNTQSLTSLEDKLRDPEFRATLKELLTGRGVADKSLGQSVLTELDRTLGVMKLIKPELAPQAGRLGVPGMGNIGAGTVAGGITGQGINPGTVSLVLGTMTGARYIAKAVATAMTTGNTGVFRAIQRAAALAPIAGRNAAAAEAFSALARQMDAWDKQTGGPGIAPVAPPASDQSGNANMGGRR